jgi:hypothetical protein
MHHSYLGTGCREVVVTELWVIELVLGVTVKRGELLQMHAVKIVVVLAEPLLQFDEWDTLSLFQGTNQHGRLIKY